VCASSGLLVYSQVRPSSEVWLFLHRALGKGQSSDQAATMSELEMALREESDETEMGISERELAAILLEASKLPSITIGDGDELPSSDEEEKAEITEKSEEELRRRRNLRISRLRRKRGAEKGGDQRQVQDSDEEEEAQLTRSGSGRRERKVPLESSSIEDQPIKEDDILVQTDESGEVKSDSSSSEEEEDYRALAKVISKKPRPQAQPTRAPKKRVENRLLSIAVEKLDAIVEEEASDNEVLSVSQVGAEISAVSDSAWIEEPESPDKVGPPVHRTLPSLFAKARDIPDDGDRADVPVKTDDVKEVTQVSAEVHAKNQDERGEGGDGARAIAEADALVKQQAAEEEARAAVAAALDDAARAIAEADALVKQQAAEEEARAAVAAALDDEARAIAEADALVKQQAVEDETRAAAALAHKSRAIAEAEVSAKQQAEEAASASDPKVAFSPMIDGTSAGAESSSLLSARKAKLDQDRNRAIKIRAQKEAAGIGDSAVDSSSAVAVATARAAAEPDSPAPVRAMAQRRERPAPSRAKSPVRVSGSSPPRASGASPPRSRPKKGGGVTMNPPFMKSPTADVARIEGALSDPRRTNEEASGPSSQVSKLSEAEL